MLENTVGTINIEQSRYTGKKSLRYKRGNQKKNRQHNGKKERNKRTNNDLQNIHLTLKIE